MISTAEEYLELIEKHKDVELGMYDREHVINEFRFDMKRWIHDNLSDAQEKALFDAIEERLYKLGVKDKTSVELHYIIRAESAVQYISPYHKYYKVGKTLKEVDEEVIWCLRPDYVKIGHIVERKWQDENQSRGVREENKHEFGEAKDVFNVFCLSTFEHQKVEEKEGTWSTVHITILIPVGDALFTQISLIRKQRNDLIMSLAARQAKAKEKLAKKKRGKYKKPVPGKKLGKKGKSATVTSITDHQSFSKKLDNLIGKGGNGI